MIFILTEDKTVTTPFGLKKYGYTEEVGYTHFFEDAIHWVQRDPTVRKWREVKEADLDVT